MVGTAALIERSGPYEDIDVYRRQFLIFGPEAWENFVPDVIDPEQWVRAGYDYLHILTGAQDQPTRVVLEGWTSEPPAESSDWSGVRLTQVFLSEPRVSLWSITGGPQSDPIEIGREPGDYTVRLFCRGRPADHPAHDNAKLRPGEEEWLIQFWPAE